MHIFGQPHQTEASFFDPTDEEYENYMAGYRLGSPVESDEPITLNVDPNNPLFQRGLQAGVRNHQENQAFLAAQGRRRFLGLF